MICNRLFKNLTAFFALFLLSVSLFAESKARLLNSSQARTMVQSYYNSHGSWAGVYRMKKINNIRLKHINQNRVEAHVEYHYQANNASSKHRAGVDKRTFMFIRHRQWSVVGMGRYMSGSF
ncbi:hypothetical protein MNBD_GAMMA12-915 [hydrothermal vent metagenome]|uniref:Uncharacterized protein n=1 Tax=hydrothermal vent metagenome TaxID=652676 RepID=A0A3B0YJK8_9ZZZZ